MRVDGWFRVGKHEVSGKTLARWKRNLTIPNYDYANAKRLGHKYSGPKNEALYEEDDHEIRLPRGYGLQVVAGSTDDGYGALEDARVTAATHPHRTTFQPRNSEQSRAIDGTLRLLGSVSHSAVLVAPPGAGKTVMALQVANRLEQRLAVIAHKEYLLDQWRERIAQFLPGVDVGLVHATKNVCDWEHPITLFMLSSLVGEREYPQEMYDYFGHVMTDEGHRLGAPVWRYAIVKFPALYRTLLTATPERVDGRHVVYERHVTSEKHEMEDVGMRPRIEDLVCRTYVPTKDYTNRWNNRTNLARLINLLADNQERTQRIARVLARAVNAGRQVIVLSDRLRHLDAIREESTAYVSSSCTWVKYVGGISDEDKERAKTADVVLGTYAMAQEGLDIPSLSVLVLATPRSNVHQAVGRILRELDGKAEPVVVDVVDITVPICNALRGAREKVYRRLGYVDVPG